MKYPFSRILYGGDYNPNQWPREVWQEDMRLFQKAGINSATVNVFSWAKIQPGEETYDFSELDDIIAMLSRENFDIVLATSTGAMPAWLVKLLAAGKSAVDAAGEALGGEDGPEK